MAAGLGATIDPESLIGYLGRKVAVRTTVPPQFQSQTVLAWHREGRSLLVANYVNITRKRTDGAADTRSRDS